MTQTPKLLICRLCTMVNVLCDHYIL